MGETRRRVLEYGTIEYYNDNGLHRDGDEPAVVQPNGGQLWYKNGEIHRDGDKPAVIHANGDQFWYKNDARHRDGDAPACIRRFHILEWYKNGKRHRDNDLPAIVLTRGDKYWFKNGIKHRGNDLPAYVHGDKKIWYKDDKVHRETGAAVLPENEYYLEGMPYTYENWVRELTKMQRTLLALWFYNRLFVRRNQYISTNDYYNSYTYLPRVAFAEVLKQLSKKM